MDKEEFLKLLFKYNKGEATKEEQQLVISYYNLFYSDSDVSGLLGSEKAEELNKEIFASIKREVSKPTENSQTRKVISIRRLVSAAAILAVICTAVVFYFKPGRDNNIPKVAGTSKPRENRLLLLPDGSSVILDPGSKLNYPSSFDGYSTREVYLDGQAYFDVRHNPVKPFIVHSGELVTTVLGTAFNIKAFPSEKYVTVTVLRGKVKVGTKDKTLVYVEKNDQVLYSKADAKVVQKSLSDSAYLQWKEQDLLLDDVTFSELAELMQERYKVTIIINDSLLKNDRISTTLKSADNLDRLLISIGEFNNSTYKYNSSRDSVFISSRK